MKLLFCASPDVDFEYLGYPENIILNKPYYDLPGNAMSSQCEV